MSLLMSLRLREQETSLHLERNPGSTLLGEALGSRGVELAVLVEVRMMLLLPLVVVLAQLG